MWRSLWQLQKLVRSVARACILSERSANLASSVNCVPCCGCGAVFLLPGSAGVPAGVCLLMLRLSRGGGPLFSLAPARAM